MWKLKKKNAKCKNIIFHYYPSLKHLVVFSIWMILTTYTKYIAVAQIVNSVHVFATFFLCTDLRTYTKIESILFVSIILSFSKNLWCLNFPPAITKQFQKMDLFWCNLFWDNAPPEAANSNIINFLRMTRL